MADEKARREGAQQRSLLPGCSITQKSCIIQIIMDKKYHIIVFGCQMNTADAEKIAEILDKAGYKKSLKLDGSDLVIITMCSVRQSAVDRVFGIAEKIKGFKKKPITILTGCILKKDKKTFSEIFDYTIDIKDILKRGDKLFAGLGPLVPQDKGGSPTAGKKFVTERALATNASEKLLPSEKSTAERKYITISNGCNNYCTYCVVPYTRGNLTCIDHKKIITEAKSLIKRGARELWLLGQNVNDYSSPTNKSITFPELLEMVNALPGDFKIYFMSPNPKNFSDKLIKVMAKSEKFSRYLNLPIQSGDDEVLKRMNRPYTAQKYIALVKKLRKAMPDLNLSTDVIVGFPGETKKQFNNTAKLFRKIKYNIAYINKYSVRWGTVASKMKDNVSWDEKKRREKILIDIVNGK